MTDQKNSLGILGHSHTLTEDNLELTFSEICKRQIHFCIELKIKLYILGFGVGTKTILTYLGCLAMLSWAGAASLTPTRCPTSSSPRPRRGRRRPWPMIPNDRSGLRYKESILISFFSIWYEFKIF